MSYLTPQVKTYLEGLYGDITSQSAIFVSENSGVNCTIRQSKESDSLITAFMLCTMNCFKEAIIATLPKLAAQNSHRLLHLWKTAETWNKVVLLYQQERPSCTGLLSPDLASEERGFGSRMRLRGTKCSYSPRLQPI